MINIRIKVKERVHSPVWSSWYYKTITIVIMMIVSDATIWSVIYNRN
jgi:hypothetical protein